MMGIPLKLYGPRKVKRHKKEFLALGCIYSVTKRSFGLIWNDGSHDRLALDGLWSHFDEMMGFG